MNHPETEKTLRQHLEPYIFQEYRETMIKRCTKKARRVGNFWVCDCGYKEFA